MKTLRRALHLKARYNLLNLAGRFLAALLAGALVTQPSFCFASSLAGEHVVDYQGTPQRVVYDLYLPSVTSIDLLPVLVCVGGLPMDGDIYLTSDPRECRDEQWRAFADENGVAVLGVGFLFIEDDWSGRASYQYPRAWSGRALTEILDELAAEFPVDPNRLYFFGISAGAQYAVRFAQMDPRRVRAVAAHAAGGYDEPSAYIPSKLLVTVGEDDNAPVPRLDRAIAFVEACRKLNVDVRLEVIPGIAHRQTEGQNKLSRSFFQRLFE